MGYEENSLRLHHAKKGKIEVVSKVPIKTREDLTLAYTPGVAEPCRKIHGNPEDAYKYTAKGNMIAVVTDGSAVLGLGDIGPLASLPVMEGKAILFKEFGNVDAFPIAIDSNDVDEIVRTVKNIAPMFGGINLEDISAPRCFEVEERLKKELDIPVFHDDQHGTAIVTCAGLMNALKLAKKSFGDVKIVISGAGAAGISVTNMLFALGAENIIVCDSKGSLYKGRKNMNKYKEEVANVTNKDLFKGSLKDALKGADVFIGVSAGNLLSGDDIENMNKDPLVFAMSNPTPEVNPEEALEAGAFILATGRSDYPNQINNVLAFPGVLRGLLDCRANNVTMEIKLAAARALAAYIPEEELATDNIIPDVLDKEVSKAVADAVVKACS